MRICRYNEGRLGLVENETVYDVSSVLDQLPTLTWPVAPGDLLIEHLARLTPPGHAPHIHLTLSDEHPYALAFVVIEALPLS